jgi:hypothetical protein
MTGLSVLSSYAYASEHRDLPGGHLMLDSGGFTAFTRGQVITVPELCDWYRTIDAERYAVLDVIYDPEQSRRNALEMRDLGVSVTPAVHAGTSPAEVDRLAADGFTTIALGGLVNKHNGRSHADAWAHACLDRARAHGMTAHGFGLCSANASRLPLMMRFASVDASTWLLGRYSTTPLWTGSMLRAYDWHRDRLAIAAILRRWPGTDFTPALTRQRGARTGGTLLMHVAGAASLLAYGEWLMRRGGPRVYLAGYFGSLPQDWDIRVTTILDAIAPREAAA